MSEFYQHRKTGGIYVIVCHAELESDLTPMVVYRSFETGRTWIRPHSEFFDGRFALVRPEETKYIYNSGIGGGR